MIGRSLVIALAAGLVATGAAEARDQIRIVGSSTVFPFSTAVAEQFGKTTTFKTPVVESTGTGGGMKLFCAGIGEGHPDITNASRRIKSSEAKDCAGKGIDITEVKVGFDGIVLANAKSGPSVTISRQSIFLALAKDIWKDGKLVPNPYTTWNQIDPSLPSIKIEVLGPPPTSGTRDAFVELVMEHGAEEAMGDLKKMDAKLFKTASQTIREDGAYIDAGENDNLIVQKLVANPNAMGVFGFSFLDQNGDKLKGAVVEGNRPTFENIASGKYPVSRSLFFYVKKQHVGVIPGVEEFVKEFTSEKAWGPDGYLVDKGLIPLPEAERKTVAAQAQSMAPLSM
ncbi:MAG: PstS family phosphate ABC transporter substrate-binding protein [Alphaproteobacteria bacterium]